MTIEPRRMTAAAFDAFIQQPQQADQRLELVAGECVPAVWTPQTARIADRISSALHAFLKHHPLGWLPADRAIYAIDQDRYMPATAFTATERAAQPVTVGCNPVAPDLAVEIVPPDQPQAMRRLLTKVSNYMAAWTTVWVVLPETREISVHAPAQRVCRYRATETVDAGPVLPGFTLSLPGVFDPPDVVWGISERTG